MDYKIQFHSYWHAGSGLSGGTTADNEVIKTKDQLPFIPGKTLKGLLRAAASDLKDTETGLVTDEFIKEVFGVKDSSGTDCWFSNAYLSDSLQNFLRVDTDTRNVLYQNVSSTAIGKNGQANPKSLRTMEVCVPLVLFAEIKNFPIEKKRELESCMKYIKRLGTKRHRGFGRCDWSIIK